MSSPDLFTIGEVVEEEKPRKRALSDTLGPYWRKGPSFSTTGRRPSAQQARRHIRDYAELLNAEMKRAADEEEEKKETKKAKRSTVWVAVGPAAIPRPPASGRVLLREMYDTLELMRLEIAPHDPSPTRLLPLLYACTLVQMQLKEDGRVSSLPSGYAALALLDDPLALNGAEFHALFGDLLIEREIKTLRAMVAMMAPRADAAPAPLPIPVGPVTMK
jgi:hypothetical protein